MRQAWEVRGIPPEVGVGLPGVGRNEQQHGRARRGGDHEGQLQLGGAVSRIHGVDAAWGIGGHLDSMSVRPAAIFEVVGVEMHGLERRSRGRLLGARPRAFGGPEDAEARGADEMPVEAVSAKVNDLLEVPGRAEGPTGDYIFARYGPFSSEIHHVHKADRVKLTSEQHRLGDLAIEASSRIAVFTEGCTEKERARCRGQDPLAGGDADLIRAARAADDSPGDCQVLADRDGEEAPLAFVQLVR